jgi:hypothetical protein
MRKLLLSALLSGVFCMTSVQGADMVEPLKSDVIVHKKPPKAAPERHPASPGPDYMWIDGYQLWNGAAYAWQPGHWEKPPHEHAIWMEPRWQRREGGYVFTPGWWT